MIKKFLYRVVCGFFLGLSVVAPGFSGSVVAIAMGIYQDLIRIASNPLKKLKQNILFCIPLVVGAAISAVVCVISFHFLFETYPKATYLLFIGLIVGNLPVIFSEIKKCGWKARYLLAGTVVFAVALALSLFASGIAETSGTATLEDFSLPLLAVSGFAGGATALIPGMSVSMVLAIFGVLKPAFAAADSIVHMDFLYLIPFGLFGVCAVAGLVLTSKGIKFLFEKLPGFANTAVFGFMAGSLIGILVQSLSLDSTHFNWWLGGTMLAAGLGVSMLFVGLGMKMNKE